MNHEREGKRLKTKADRKKKPIIPTPLPTEMDLFKADAADIFDQLHKWGVTNAKFEVGYGGRLQITFTFSGITFWIVQNKNPDYQGKFLLDGAYIDPGGNPTYYFFNAYGLTMVLFFILDMLRREMGFTVILPQPCEYGVIV
jgi:hypothetical protein